MGTKTERQKQLSVAEQVRGQCRWKGQLGTSTPARLIRTQIPRPALEQSVTPQVVCLVGAGLRSCLAIPEGFLEEGDFQAGEKGRS